MKKKIIISLIVAVLTLAIAVPVAAAAGVKATGSSSLLDYAKSLVQQLVTDKKLAQADADQVIASLDSKAQTLQAERQAMGGKGGIGGVELTEAATALGMTEADLSAKLAQGTTIWKIASDAGKLDALKDALIKSISTRLDAMVTAGRLTKETAAQQLADATAKIKAITQDSTESLRGLAVFDMGGKGGMRGGPGRGDRSGQQNGAGNSTNPSAPAASTSTSSQSSS